MLVTIDGPMIHRFIDDVGRFRECADERFHELDADADGLLLRDDLQRGFSPPVASDHEPAESAENLVFDKFDVDESGSIDKVKFRSVLAEILMAVARGIGPTPVIIGVGVDSLLLKAYESEVERIERILAEIADCKLKLEESEIKTMKTDLKRKKSKKLFGIGMCVCGPKYLGED